MLNLKVERNKAMKRAYGFAKSGNAKWAQMWIDRANDFLPVHPLQLAYVNRLLKEARSRLIAEDVMYQRRAEVTGRL